MREIVVGLIKGRHEMPVENYIFNDAIKDVHDYDTIYKHIEQFVVNNVGIEKCIGYGINQADYSCIDVFSGKNRLVVYVTGLTCVTAELIKCCALNGIHLTLMHFDVASNDYKKQLIF